MALFIGQKWEWVRLARLILVAALVVLVIALFGVRSVGIVAWLTLIVPGIILLFTVPFFGPMPSAGEELSLSRGDYCAAGGSMVAATRLSTSVRSSSQTFEACSCIDSGASHRLVVAT